MFLCFFGVLNYYSWPVIQTYAHNSASNESKVSSPHAKRVDEKKKKTMKIIIIFL